MSNRVRHGIQLLGLGSVNIKKFLEETDWSGMFTGRDDAGDIYQVDFALKDIRIIQEYEFDKYIIDEPNFKLEKPICALFVDKSCDTYTGNMSSLDTVLHVQHLVIVNYHLGKLYLDGYLSLLEEVYKTDRGGDLVELGFKSLRMDRERVVDGGELYNSLQRKILVQPLSVYLQVL